VPYASGVPFAVVSIAAIVRSGAPLSSSRSIWARRFEGSRVGRGV
jgi:hypothetical protein